MDLCPESDGFFTADFCFRLVENEDDESTLGEKFCAIRRKRCENYKLELHLPTEKACFFTRKQSQVWLDERGFQTQCFLGFFSKTD